MSYYEQPEPIECPACHGEEADCAVCHGDGFVTPSERREYVADGRADNLEE